MTTEELNTFLATHKEFFLACQRERLVVSTEMTQEMISSGTIDGMEPMEWLDAMTME